jgi:hypothetical protein
VSKRQYADIQRWFVGTTSANLFKNNDLQLVSQECYIIHVLTEQPFDYASLPSHWPIKNIGEDGSNIL